MLSRDKLLLSMKRWEMVRLPLPMVMVGVLVALAAKTYVLATPGILF